MKSRCLKYVGSVDCLCLDVRLLLAGYVAQVDANRLRFDGGAVTVMAFGGKLKLTDIQQIQTMEMLLQLLYT